MELQFGFGKTVETVEVNDNNLIDVLRATKIEHKLLNEEAVKDAILNPIGSKRLKDIVKPGNTVAIVTSDITRPLPTYHIMPSLLEELYEGGVKKEDITLIFALGNHRKQTVEEKEHLAGEKAAKEIALADSTDFGFKHFGYTKNGTPVDICEKVANADIRICLGNVEYHYFAGYSGGVKAIMPGVSTRDAIQKNHSLMVDEKACAGNIIDNPIRRDIEEAGKMVGVDFIVNVVLDEKKNIVFAAAGDAVKAHRTACSYLDKMYLKPIKERADIVIVSQGGAPKDLNLYQTQKALDNAKHAVKKGGTVILVGSCKEGLGEKTFEEWITTAKTPDSLIKRIRKEFKLGGHKAAAIAMVLQNADIYLVSELDEELVKSIFMKPYKSVQSAFDDAIKKYGENATVIAMPYGGSTLPRVNNK
ncbi:MAG: nickel-dependent lactate racemase [Clostridia bacterium]|nr:nickel-dependent lactate racemase [Clostridia bacterium]